MSFLVAHWGEMVGVLWAASEVLADIPGLKSNSLFQLGRNLMKKLIGK